jgi:hypothetical protein
LFRKHRINSEGSFNRENGDMDGLMDHLSRRNRNLIDIVNSSNTAARAASDDNQDIYIARSRLGGPSSRLSGPAYRR